MLMTIDLLPTIAHLTGAELPKRQIDGLNVWPQLSGEKEAKTPHEAYFSWYANNQLQAVTSGDGRWKLILPHTYRTLAGQSGGKDGIPAKYDTRTIEQPELYELISDVSESTNVADRHPEVVQRLLALAEEARMELGDKLTEREGRGVRQPGQLGATP
jgi:arylsulfatase